MELENQLHLRIELVFCSVHFLSNFDIVVVKSFLVAVEVVTELSSSIGLYVDCFFECGTQVSYLKFDFKSKYIQKSFQKKKIIKPVKLIDIKFQESFNITSLSCSLVFTNQFKFSLGSFHVIC